jgi:hypothetical protein
VKIENKVARELAYLDAGDAVDWDEIPEVDQVVENRHTGEQTRWDSIHELVVRTVDDALWQVFYREGLTERQDYGPFEYAPDEIKFTRVKPVPKTVITYEPAKESK